MIFVSEKGEVAMRAESPINMVYSYEDLLNVFFKSHYFLFFVITQEQLCEVIVYTQTWNNIIEVKSSDCADIQVLSTHSITTITV